MTALPEEDAFLAAMEATWPAAARLHVGPFVVRSGQGGGKRVSAATAHGAVTPPALEAAEAAMRDLGQAPLFMLRPAEADLDRMLDLRGYAIVDPVELHAAPIAQLGPPPGDMEVFPHWPPLAMAVDIWAEAGIGPARIAVMARTAGPRTVFLARSRDRSVGVAFAAVHDGIVMLHAVDVLPEARRRGVGGQLVRAAASWGAAHGAKALGLAVTRANTPAKALYASLGLRVVGEYFYRQG